MSLRAFCFVHVAESISACSLRSCISRKRDWRISIARSELSGAALLINRRTRLLHSFDLHTCTRLRASLTPPVSSNGDVG